MKKNEEKIVESYKMFLSQIGTNNKNNENLIVKILFIMSIVSFLYGVVTMYRDDLYLDYVVFDPIFGLLSLMISFSLFIIAWKKRNKNEYFIRKKYKPIFENCLNIKWSDLPLEDEELVKYEDRLDMKLNDILPENAELDKLNKKEYIEAGFKYADDKDDNIYESSEKIELNDSIEAYLVQIIDKFVGSNDVPHYIIDGWITKQKININSEKYVFDIEKLISEFNIKYDYNLKNKIELNIHNGYLYIYIDDLSLYFSYSKLTDYNTYKEIYLKIKLLKDLSEFIYNKI